VALASITDAPEAAADLADALANGGRLGDLDTGNLMRIVKAKDGHLSDRFIGLYPALGRVPPQQKERLAAILFNVFRPELIKRFATLKKGTESGLLDMLVDLTRLKKEIAGWEAIGSPKPAERIWRYHSFDPLAEKDKLHPRVGPPKRLRDVTLPAGMDKWYMPDFDDSTWKSGKAPIGVGVFKAHGHGRGWTARPDHSFKNNSDWGDGEFLLMRTSFDVTDLDHDYYRIRILSDQGYHIYLNGRKIHTFVWFQHVPNYRQIMLTGKETRHLKKGANTLAVFGNVRYEKDGSTGDYHPIGQLDLLIEGLKKGELGLRN
jgi:hypothetical protein